MKPLEASDTRPMQHAPRRTLWSVQQLAPALVLALAPLLGHAQQTAFLLSDAAATMTGAALVVDGGYTLQPSSP